MDADSINFSEWNQIPVILSDGGDLQQPNVHDWYLTGILLSKDTECVIIMEDETFSKKAAFKLLEIQQINVDNFGKRNIILDVEICRGDNIIKYDLWVRFLCLLYPYFDCNFNDSIDKLRDAFKVTINSILEEKLSIILISPSDGCQIVCIYKDLILYTKELPSKKSGKFGDA